MFSKINRKFCLLLILYLIFSFDVTACGVFDFYTHYWTVPVVTESGGGTNSFESPKIHIYWDRCISFVHSSHDSMVTAGDAYTPGGILGHTFYALIHADTKVCNNKCTYAYACTEDQKKTMSPDSTSPLCTKKTKDDANMNCDPQVSSVALRMCEATENDTDNKKMIGICAYRSKKAGISTLLTKIANDIMHIGLTILNPAAGIACFLEKGCNITLPNDIDSTPINCYPVPVGAFPPPFCKKRMGKSDLRILRICKEGETPIRTLSGSAKGCVKPRDGTSSTFMRPCVRVTYDNPKEATSLEHDTNDNYNYYTQDNKEILYTSDEIPKPEGAKDINIRYAELYDESLFRNIGSSSLKLAGFNDANYKDICVNIDANGDISSQDQQQDFVVEHENDSNQKNNDTIKLKLSLKCDQDSCTGENGFKSRQVCVSIIAGANNREILQGCVDRPEMSKPTVSFCNNNLNDKASACMKVEAATSASTTGSYNFNFNNTNSVIQCADAQRSNTQLCTLDSSNPFGFQAILTNRCYVNGILAIQEPSMLNKCYKNNNSCSTPINSGGCNKCSIDEYCFKQYSNKTTPAQVTGAERLCLYGYTGFYKLLSNIHPWCKEPCGLVCANAQRNDKNQYINNALVDVTNRITPSPSTTSPLTNVQSNSCAYSTSILSSSSETYRVRNPVEEDLCVDVYTIKFNKSCKKDSKFPPTSCSKIKNSCSGIKDLAQKAACTSAYNTKVSACKLQIKTFPTQVCQNVRKFCSVPKNTSTNRHYKNFDTCQKAFKDCLADPASMDNRKLGNNSYTCLDLSQIISAN